jgi:hypothetical protein
MVIRARCGRKRERGRSGVERTRVRVKTNGIRDDPLRRKREETRQRNLYAHLQSLGGSCSRSSFAFVAFACIGLPIAESASLRPSGTCAGENDETDAEQRMSKRVPGNLYLAPCTYSLKHRPFAAMSVCRHSRCSGRRQRVAHATGQS